MAADDKVRTRSATEFSEIIKGVINSATLGEYIGNIVTTAVSECIKSAVSEATEDLRKEIFSLKKVIIELKNRSEKCDVSVNSQHKPSDNVIVNKNIINKTMSNPVRSNNVISKDSPIKEASANRTYSEAVSIREKPLNEGEEIEMRSGKNETDCRPGTSNEKEDVCKVVNYRRRKRQTIVGTGEINETADFTAADSFVWMYVGRVKAGVTSENVMQYIKSKTSEDTVIHVEELKTLGANKSLKVGINSIFKEKVYDPSFWPTGTIIRRFEMKLFRDRRDKYQQWESGTTAARQ